MEPTIYQQVLGEKFSSLPICIRTLHSLQGQATYAGRTNIQRGSNPLAALCALLTGLPPAMRDAPTRVEFLADHRREVWRRDFGGKGMSSTLTCRDALLCERLGAMQFRFELQAVAGEIRWIVRGVRLLGLVPLPTGWFRGVRCREREAQGRYEFLVEAAMPLIGLLVRYEGWLEPA
jgi:hypothetical protein